MAKKEEDKNQIALAKPGELALPDFMQGEAHGVDQLNKVIRPPRIKVVQKMSGGVFSEKFNVGDVIMVPQCHMLAPVKLNDKGKPTDEGNPLYFVPLFFFVEWCAWNPIDLRGTVNAVRERSFDPKSEIAIRSRDEKTRLGPYPEDPTNPKLAVRYVEHLNYVVMLIEHETATGIPMVMSFARAEHAAGSNFAALIKMRRSSIFGGQFEAVAKHRTNQKGDWFGIDVSNPRPDAPVGPWVSRDMYDAFKVMHEEYSKAHADKLIDVDYEDPDAGEVDAEQVANTGEF